MYIGEADASVFEDESYFNNWSRFHGLEQWWQETAVQFSDWYFLLNHHRIIYSWKCIMMDINVLLCRTLIVFSVERLVAISKPLNYRNRLTVRRAIYLELLLLLLAALPPWRTLSCGTTSWQMTMGLVLSKRSPHQPSYDGKPYKGRPR